MIKGRYSCVLKTLLDDPITKAEIDKAMSSYPLYEQKSKGEFIEVHIPTREELNKKILNHYKYKEIGFIAPARFIDELEIALNEIMPYYNQLMMTIDQDYNFLYNADYTREFEGTKNGTSETLGSSTNTTNASSETNNKGTNTSESHNDTLETSITSADTQSDNKNVNIDTPQGIVKDVTSIGIDDVSHASSVSFNSSTGTDSGKTTGNGSSDTTASQNSTGETLFKGSNEINDESRQNITNEDIERHIERVKGNYGQVSFQSMIKQYRELIINIEQKIIYDQRLAELFMSIF